MSSPRPLDRRVQRTEEDVEAVSDLLIDVKEIVERHTSTLDEIKNQVTRLDTKVGSVETSVNERITALETSMNSRFEEILGLLRRG
jgi:archaellum component FlaC